MIYLPTLGKKNVYRLIFHLLNSIFILSNFSQTISLYSLGGPSASRACVFANISCTPGSLVFKHPRHTVLDGSLENKISKFCVIESYLWELRFWRPLKVKLRMSHLMLHIRFGKSGHGKASAFTMTDVMLSRVSENAANKNLLWPSKHATRTVAKCAGKKSHSEQPRKAGQKVQ